MDLHFSQEEMIEFLKRKYYEEVEIKVWDNKSVYHNRVETTNEKIQGAVKIGEKLPLDEDGEMQLCEAEFYLIKNVFNRELKEILLSL